MQNRKSTEARLRALYTEAVRDGYRPGQPDSQAILLAAANRLGITQDEVDGLVAAGRRIIAERKARS